MDVSTTMSNETILMEYIRIIEPSGCATNNALLLCELKSGTTGQLIADSWYTVSITE